MIEVEIKAEIDDPDRVKSKLKTLGCIYLGHQIHSDTYYNAQDRDFAKTDEALRIRRNGDRSAITYKGPKIDSLSKSRKEIELEIGNPEAAEEILTALGFTRVLTDTKSRANYRLSQYIISLDAVAGLGNFIEIETSANNEREVPSKVDEIIKLLPDLGIRQDATITKSYLELLLEKK